MQFSDDIFSSLSILFMNLNFLNINMLGKFSIKIKIKGLIKSFCSKLFDHSFFSSPEEDD